MLENIMHKMGGISIYGVISICIFFALFAGIILWAARLKNNYLDPMRALPLDNESAPECPPERGHSCPQQLPNSIPGGKSV